MFLYHICLHFNYVTRSFPNKWNKRELNNMLVKTLNLFYKDETFSKIAKVEHLKIKLIKRSSNPVLAKFYKIRFLIRDRPKMLK